MEIGDSVKIGLTGAYGGPMVFVAWLDATVIEMSDKGVRLESNGRKCWFPKKALVPNDQVVNPGLFSLAQWFSGDDYVHRFLGHALRHVRQYTRL